MELSFGRNFMLVTNHLKTKTDWCRPHTTPTTWSKLWRTTSLVEADLLHLSMLRLEGVGGGSKGQPRGSLRAKVLNARSTSCTVSCLTRPHAGGGVGSASFPLYTRGSLHDQLSLSIKGITSTS